MGDKMLIPSLIDIEVKTVDLKSIIDKIENGTIELENKEILFSDKQQSRLIESLIARIPIGVISFYEDMGKTKVIDGEQRLLILKNFLLEGKKLNYLEYYPEYNGFAVNELPSYLIRRINESMITTYRIRQRTSQKVVENITQRIQTKSF